MNTKQNTASAVLELAVQSATMPELRSKISAHFGFPEVHKRLARGTHRALFPLPNGLILKSCYRPYYPEHDSEETCRLDLEFYGSLDSNAVEFGLFTKYPEIRRYLPTMYGHYVSPDWVGHEDCSGCAISDDPNRTGMGHVRIEQRPLASAFPELAKLIGTEGRFLAGGGLQEPVSGINVLVSDRVERVSPTLIYYPESKHYLTAKLLQQIFVALRDEEIGVTDAGRVVALDAGAGLCLTHPPAHEVDRWVRNLSGIFMVAKAVQVVVS